MGGNVVITFRDIFKWLVLTDQTPNIFNLLCNKTRKIKFERFAFCLENDLSY